MIEISELDVLEEGLPPFVSSTAEKSTISTYTLKQVLAMARVGLQAKRFLELLRSHGCLVMPVPPTDPDHPARVVVRELSEAQLAYAEALGGVGVAQHSQQGDSQWKLCPTCGYPMAYMDTTGCWSCMRSGCGTFVNAKGHVTGPPTPHASA